MSAHDRMDKHQEVLHWAFTIVPTCSDAGRPKEARGRSPYRLLDGMVMGHFSTCQHMSFLISCLAPFPSFHRDQYQACGKRISGVKTDKNVIALNVFLAVHCRFFSLFATRFIHVQCEGFFFLYQHCLDKTTIPKLFHHHIKTGVGNKSH